MPRALLSRLCFYAISCERIFRTARFLPEVAADVLV